jgi:hypothetical protein
MPHKRIYVNAHERAREASRRRREREETNTRAVQAMLEGRRAAEQRAFRDQQAADRTAYLEAERLRAAQAIELYRETVAERAKNGRVVEVGTSGRRPNLHAASNIGARTLLRVAL